MNKWLRMCGLGALVISAVCVTTQAEAGGRRRACNYDYNYQGGYYGPAPAVVGSTATTDGRQRYQSAYQAPATVTTGPVYTAPVQRYDSGYNYSDPYYYGTGYYRQPHNAFDPSAVRKVQDGRMQH